MTDVYGMNEIGALHNEWIESVGWHNKTPLEYLALVGSEVGEAVNCVRGELPTPELGEELADVLLRTLDLMIEYGLDPEAECLAKIEKNKTRGTRGRLK